jgi:hypothetical protein
VAAFCKSKACYIGGMHRSLIALPILILFLVSSVVPFSFAAKRKSRKKAHKAQSSMVEIPINVGFGPAFHMVTGPIQDNQLLHYGLKLSVAAVIDRATIQQNKNKIPARYRNYVDRVGEIRIGKIYVPDTIFISPKVNDTQMYGATFKPIALGIPLIKKGVTLDLKAGLILTYAFIESKVVLTKAMHFFRPGIDLKAELEIPFSNSFLMSVGWVSQFYVPQKLNGAFFEVDGIKDSIWHIGQAFLLFHLRFPYHTRL